MAEPPPKQELAVPDALDLGTPAVDSHDLRELLAVIENIGSAVTSLPDVQPAPEIEPFILPRSKGLPDSDDTLVPYGSLHPAAPAAPLNIPPPPVATAHPSAHTPATPAPMTPLNAVAHGPHAVSLTLTPTGALASPMSVSTPLTYPVTPQTTPAHAAFAPISPVDEQLEHVRSVVPPVPDELIQRIFERCKRRATHSANEKKRLLRQQLKEVPGQKGSPAEISSRREAKVSREKVVVYRHAIERELKDTIRDMCSALSYSSSRFAPPGMESPRKRARFS